jgi:hypothetical protein
MGKNLEGGGRGLFEGIILKLYWEEEENHEIISHDSR